MRRHEPGEHKRGLDVRQVALRHEEVDVREHAAGRARKARRQIRGALQQDHPAANALQGVRDFAQLAPHDRMLRQRHEASGNEMRARRGRHLVEQIALAQPMLERTEKLRLARLRDQLFPVAHRQRPRKLVGRPERAHHDVPGQRWVFRGTHCSRLSNVRTASSSEPP